MQKFEELGVEINTDVSPRLLPFNDYFKGFEKVQGIKKLFGQSTEKILHELKVEFYSAKWGYMGVSDVDGHLLVSTHHLQTADPIILYLDVFHELHHVKQFFDGRELFSTDYEYVDNPIEIEAYKATVEEAKRLGMPEAQIVEYLTIEWITKEQLQRLVRAVGLTMILADEKAPAS
jgi:hypothetical protein